MNINQALREARVLMNMHGLRGWRIEPDRAIRRAGACHYRTRTITLSRKLTELHTPEQVRNTVLHEIAHAIAGHSAGHGPAWRKICIAIGGNGQRCYASEPGQQIPYRYVGTCPGCNRTTGRHKLSKAIKLGASCGYCAPDRFDERYRLVWVDMNGSRVHI